MRCRKIALCSLCLVLAAAGSIAAQETGQSDCEALHNLILPGDDDSQWMNVSWMPATDIWMARQKPAAEGKPIFLWYMAGEPLGPC